jgi:hypothetical protein
MGKALHEKKRRVSLCADGFQQRAISTPQLLPNNQYM